MYQSSRRGQPFASGRRHSSSQKDDLFFYFFHIDERFGSSKAFEDNWKKIPQFRFNPKQLTNILHRTAHFITDCDDPDSDFFDPDLAQELRSVIIKHWNSWEQEMKRTIGDFQPINLSNSIYAHRLLRIQPSSNFRAAWLEQSSKKAYSFNAIDFRMHYNAAAHLGIRLPQSVAQTLLKRINANSDFLRDTQKTDLLWGLAVADSIFPCAEYRQIAQLIKPLLPKSIRHLAVQKMRHDAFKWFDWEEDAANPYGRETTSRMEKDMIEVLKQAGIVTEKKKQVISGFNQAVDFTAIADTGIPIHIEIDGPMHFNEAVDQQQHRHLNPFYNGQTLFRSALLKKSAPLARILRIPYPIVDILTGDNPHKKYSAECRRKIARYFINLAAKNPPDTYRAVWLDGGDQSPPLGIVPLINQKGSRTSSQTSPSSP